MPRHDSPPPALPPRPPPDASPSPAPANPELTSAQTSHISIVASHGKRMICILRSFLLDYDSLRLEPLEDCISKFYGSIHDVSDQRGKSKCDDISFKQTFPSGLTDENIPNSESSNMKCFPQFTNGSAINIEIKKEGDDVYTLTVRLLPPTEVLPEDKDLKNKLVFMAPSRSIGGNPTPHNDYNNYNYTVPFQTLKFEATEECFLIRNVLDSVGDQYNVIIVRHGQGYHNLVGKNPFKFAMMAARTLGTADTHLTPKGIDDAKIGANSINNYFEGNLKGKCKYFSSDLYRAKETAVLIAKYFGETSVTVTQLPIIHEISNCEKADGFTGSSKPDMNFPGDLKNPKDNIYCPEWLKRQMSHYSKSLGRWSKGCGEDGIEVKIDYEKFYTKVALYNVLFSSQYGYTGNRTTRGWWGVFKDTSFLFKPYEIIELLLAFTLMDMTGNPYFYVNGGKDNSIIAPGDQFRDSELMQFPGFREGTQSKAYKYMTSKLDRTTRFWGGNRNTLKKRRKRKTNKRFTNKKRFTSKRKTNKRRTNKRENKKKRTYKKRRTIRQTK